ncbi:MAG: NAD(P)H-dependent oxidoreductase subunit E [Sandaracinaceae bacterium]|nr:NAD(P)H-dependent oxidoreductase subunit E [Sandaracinaceae bacterium]
MRSLVQLRRRRERDDEPQDGAGALTSSVLASLRARMERDRALSNESLREVARAHGLPEAHVLGVASFYADLGLAPRGRTRVRVCRGAACHAASGEAHVRWAEDALGLRCGETREDGAVSLEATYCLGACDRAPAVSVEDRVYVGLDEEGLRALARDLAGGASLPQLGREHVSRFEVFDREGRPGGTAIVLERLAAGVDARDLSVARAHGVFLGLARALERTPDEVLAEVSASGLRGRGGAGFPTGTKWSLAAPHARAAKEAFVVCNADEGDPGSYIDLHLLERDPFAVLEGLAIAGYAIGATRGVIYVRSEYPRAPRILREAVRDARAAGLLGVGILGSSFSFDVEVVQGAGSYVCGEETALLRSTEGLRGMVTARPPFPAERGLFDAPTIVQNVETLANVGWIVRHGGAAYAAHGVGKSRGTKVVCLNSLFARPGLYEVPLGTSVRVILETIAGGLAEGRTLKCVQIGGPLGGILPAHALEVPLGFEELDAVGALLGHGGIVAWDAHTDAREIALHLLEFCDEESCGKCFPCRIGARRGVEIAKRLFTPRPLTVIDADLSLLSELLETMKLGSLCAHGGGIPAPLRSLLDHYPDELRRGAEEGGVS